VLVHLVHVLPFADGKETQPWPPPIDGLLSMLVGVLVVFVIAALIVGIRRLLGLE